jgi:transposase InsO family protein
MPWRRTILEDQRIQFIVDALYGESTITELCQSFGISRKTGYKWLDRYDELGVVGLVDRSRAPHHHPNAVSSEIAARLVAIRQKHPTWGARKLLAWLRMREPKLPLPAVSTVCALLKRLELVGPRRLRRHVPPLTAPFSSCVAPNDVWCVDFKGHFLVGDGSRCDPLTISDAFSRYLLRCTVVLRTRAVDVRPAFEAAFREYGLPKAIRSDNGPPFASTGSGGLTTLSVWWVRLGIALERIDPGKPEQNGRHERMHLTLKQETARPPRATLRAQQLAFDRFRHVFNDERPHEALRQRPPAELYTPSPRPFPAHLPEMSYPGDFELRRVDSSGGISWGKRTIFIGEALSGQVVGLEQVAQATWIVRFGPIELGKLRTDLPDLGLIRPRRGALRRPHRR